MKPLSFIIDRSSSDQPHSGPTQRTISCVRSIPQIESDRQSVSSERCIFFVSDTLIHEMIRLMLPVLSDSNTISGILTPPHCSSASRAISEKRAIFDSETINFCERSDRKKINSRIPTSTHFCRIYSIFSILFGSACIRVIDLGASV
jgi:hypothetical protein